MNQADLRASMRRLIKNPTLEEVPDLWIDEFLQDGYEAVARRLPFSILDSTTDVTLVNGTQEYSLKADVYEIIQVQWNSIFLVRSDMDEYKRRGIEYKAAVATSPLVEYYHYGMTVGLYPPPNAAAVALDNHLEIRYYGNPATITSTGPVALDSLNHRPITYFAAAKWILAHPTASEQPQLAFEGLMKLFDGEIAAATAVYERRLVGKGTPR